MLSAVECIPSEDYSYDAVVLCHGFNAGKDHLLIKQLSERLNRDKFFTLRFDFRGYGGSTGSFADQTVSSFVEDTLAVVDYLHSHSQVRKVCLLGHSLGAAAALGAAARDSRVAAASIVACPLDVSAIVKKRLSRQELNTWLDRGFIAFGENKVNAGFIRDMESLDLAHIAHNNSIPKLFCIGDADELVRLDDARSLFREASGPKELAIIEGANHNFQGCEDRLADNNIDFFRRCLL